MHHSTIRAHRCEALALECYGSNSSNSSSSSSGASGGASSSGGVVVVVVVLVVVVVVVVVLLGKVVVVVVRVVVVVIVVVVVVVAAVVVVVIVGVQVVVGCNGSSSRCSCSSGEVTVLRTLIPSYHVILQTMLLFSLAIYILSPKQIQWHTVGVSEDAVAEQIRIVSDIAKKNGGTDFYIAKR